MATLTWNGVVGVGMRPGASLGDLGLRVQAIPLELGQLKVCSWVRAGLSAGPTMLQFTVLGLQGPCSLVELV